ncbi:hypothetical protein Taro_047827 [Colocasia esculenta]|uniref:FLZ-type domain-containing protein n=1 Tax=Colocasia esculenta TaxID=4460 RepID=A0A843WU08_COLES|nr:hypothetical protein [Colocasia esculenta]
MAASVRSHGDVTFSLETPREEERRRFLDACFLCRQPLRSSSEVFMYRGDTPFCSEDCRQEQIELDEAQEREDRYQRRRNHRHRASPAEQPSSAAEAVAAS